MTVIFFFTLFFATRAIPWKRKPGTLDHLIYINLAYLAVVFVRNPVGFWAMQTSMVGGRPYVEIILAFCSFIVLSRVQITDLIARVFPFFFVVPAWSVALLDLVGRFFPQLSYPLSSVYSGVGSGSLGSLVPEEAKLGETRIGGLQHAGMTSVLALCAKYSPSTLISPLYPGRAALFLIALAAIFLSGFRSMLLFALVVFLLAVVLRGRLRELWIAGSMMCLLLIVLVSLQGTVLQLPKTMQRAMSWLPGDWNQEVVADAENSSRWRFEMWGWAWNDERILRDRIWGQGFGFSLDDMNLIVDSMMVGQGGQSRLGGSDRESFLITGSFHNGPLSSVKYIGVVVLCLYYPLMCYMALYAWRLCKRARNTKAFSLALFVGIPIIYEPFNFGVVFGALDQN
jgi:energy-coupling factor transporter transmembrane protein EcfT